MSSVEYVYCVVPAEFELDDQMLGIDNSQVRLISYTDIAAVVSTLDREQYPIEAIEQKVADVDWLTPRALAHDRVITACSDRSATIPMPMWSIFSDESVIVHSLETRVEALRAYLEKVKNAREYTVRVFVYSHILQPSIATLSTTLADLEQEAGGASPGQAYLLQRKIEAERKLTTGRIIRQVAGETYTELSAFADESMQEPVAQRDENGQAVLNASFLVSHGQFDAFREALTALIGRYGTIGFRFEFTGPWPPYHFVDGG